MQGHGKWWLRLTEARPTSVEAEALTPASLPPPWKISRSCNAPGVLATSIEAMDRYPREIIGGGKLVIDPHSINDGDFS
jgi:hypothetical protein